MTANPRADVALQLAADLAFVPLVNGFVEQAARTLGLGGPEGLALALAVEEVFSFVCRTAAPRCAVGLAARSTGYGVEFEASFEAGDLDLGAFNLTRGVRADDEESLEELGLVLASRLVDRLAVTDGPRGGVTLTLAKDRAYPPGDPIALVAARSRGPLTVRPAHDEEVKLVAGLARGGYPPEALPEGFGFPGKLVDRARAGDTTVLAAVGPGGHLAGAVLWGWAGARTAEFHGPFLFSAPEGADAGGLLVDALVSAVARTPAVGLFTRVPTAALPEASFEPLGALETWGEGAWVEQPARFRLLHEDPGSVAWCHRELEGFLRREYQRLVLPRDLRLVFDGGERRPAHSVLSAHLRRSRREAVLRPLRAGDDAAVNLGAHLDLLAREGLPSTLFELDLGAPWQAGFTPALVSLGFQPRLLVPYGGQGDLVVFQRVGT